MMVYGGPVAGKALDELRRYRMGRLVSPRGWKRPVPGVPWVVDSDAYRAFLRGEPWDEEAYAALFYDVEDDGPGKIWKAIYETEGANPPDWLVIPDVVCGGMESLHHSRYWFDRLDHSLRWYLAVQPGMTMDAVAEAWDEAEEDAGVVLRGIFVGGDLAYKWKTLRAWRLFTRDRGAGLHVGGLSGVKALARAELAGADSVDSSAFARFGSYQNVQRARDLVHRVRARTSPAP
jgi:hypothetical protein